ncbi:PREDICTED: basic proline-rich protein-like, partial [Chinchilla lanigera]|uniref:basic proline-rich protein-like n=1 Tax=Chinchilla lanigera TaxID=34839 RepID=UPI000695D967
VTRAWPACGSKPSSTPPSAPPPCPGRPRPPTSARASTPWSGPCERPPGRDGSPGPASALARSRRGAGVGGRGRPGRTAPGTEARNRDQLPGPLLPGPAAFSRRPNPVFKERWMCWDEASVQASVRSLPAFEPGCPAPGAKGCPSASSLGEAAPGCRRPKPVLRRHLAVSGSTAGRSGLQRVFAGINLAI